MQTGDLLNIKNLKRSCSTGLGGSLYDPTSGTDYTLGVALKVNDQLNVLAGTTKGQSTDTGGLANALAPFKGSSSTFIGASFKLNESVELNGVIQLGLLLEMIMQVYLYLLVLVLRLSLITKGQEYQLELKLVSNIDNIYFRKGSLFAGLFLFF